jgi:DNA-binding response OmpR family regulator
VLRRTSPEPVDSPPEIVRTASVVVDFGRREVRVRDRAVELPPAEFELLAVLARAPGRVFTRDELVERAFGPSYEGLDRTIDAHVMRLRRKVERKGMPRLLVTVFGVGYKLDDSAAP